MSVYNYYILGVSRSLYPCTITFKIWYFSPKFYLLILLFFHRFPPNLPWILIMALFFMIYCIIDLLSYCIYCIVLFCYFSQLIGFRLYSQPLSLFSFTWRE